MLFLSFVWLLVIISELVNGMSPLLHGIGTVLWALFVFYFGLRLAVAPNKAVFLKRNWLFILAILVPVLRLFPYLQSLPIARALTATFGMQVVWIFASADQGLRSLRRTLGRRGVGYALTFTMIVILAGAAGMLHFEKTSAGPQGGASQLSECDLVGRHADNQYWIRVPAGNSWWKVPLSRDLHLRRRNIRLFDCDLCHIFYRPGSEGSKIRDPKPDIHSPTRK